MSVIPFGVVGAVIDHWIMGVDLTLLSFMGMLALSGVVVNDPIVLVDYTNLKRKEGMNIKQAVFESGGTTIQTGITDLPNDLCGFDAFVV
jgi:multidrug efflux pump subunit AcrB